MSYEPDDLPDWYEQGFDSEAAAENAWQCQAENAAAEAEERAKLWHWTRFHADPGDWRPVYKIEDGHPGLGPYWCSGYGEDYSIICAWMKPGVDVTVYWPEATHVTQDEEPSPIRFTDRFPKPDWWDDV